MDKVQQIKTYLQNQKKEWRIGQSSEAKYRIEAIDEFLEVLNSLPEEPVSEDLEEAARKIATRHSHITGDTYYANDAWFFKKGAQWQQEQFEKNRLTACDNMTDKEYEREQKFVLDFVKRNSRTPTFSDCIEITRKEMIDRACRWLKESIEHAYFRSDLYLVNGRFINDFKKEMEK